MGQSMLAQMRKATRSWVALVLIVPLVAVFAFLGMGNDPLQLLTPPNEVASGKKVSIDSKRLLRSFDQQLDRIQQQNPGQTITRDQAIEAGFHTAVLQNLISEAALEAAIDRIGLAASDGAVARTVREIPGVKSDLTGRFDQELFNRLVRSNGFSDTNEFLEQVRSDLRRNQLSSMAGHALHTPQAMARLLFDLQTEQRVISVAQVSERSITMPGLPTDAELQAYYEQEAAARFSLPERRKLTIFAARAEDFLPTITVDEAELRELFEFRKEAKSTPERRSFVQVSAQSKASAEEAARRLAAGEEPGAVAQAVGGASVTFDNQTRAELPDQAVAEAVFRRQEGETTAAVRGDLKVWVAAKVTGVTASESPQFEALRDELRQERAQEKAEELASEASEEFEKLLAEGVTADAAAQQTGLKVLTPPALTKEGRDIQSGETLWPAGPILEEAFKLPVGEATLLEPVEGGVALARVEAIEPAGPVPLQQVRDNVLQQYMAQEISKRARAAAELVRARATETGDLEAAAKALNADIIFSARPVTRALFQQAPDPSIVNDIFRAKEGAVVVTFGGAWVARIDKIEKLDPAQAQPLFEQAKAQARAQLEEDVVFAVRAQAVDEANAKVNEAMLARLFTPSTAAP